MNPLPSGLSRLAAVAATYSSRRFFWWVAAAAGLYVVIAILLAPPADPGSANSWAQALVGLPAMMSAFLLASQAKWQFVNPRARTLPGYTAPHLATLLLLALVGLGGLQSLAASRVGLNVLGAAACAIGIGACFTWAMHATRTIPNLLGLVIFFSLMSKVGCNFWLHPAFAADGRLAHLAILATGWASIGRWLFRLARLNEECQDYNIPVQAQSGSATRMERSQASRNMALQLSRSGLTRAVADWWHDCLTAYRPRTLGDYQRLLRYGFAAAPIELNLVMFGGMMMVIFYFTGQMVSSDTGQMAPSDHGFLFGPLMMFSIWPGSVPGQFLTMRRARLAQELLLPLTRRELVDGIGWALVRMTTISWVTLALACVGLSLSIGVQLPARDRLAGWLIISLAVQPYLLGFMTYIARVSSAAVRFALMMLGLLPCMLAGMAGIGILHAAGLGALLPYAALLVAVGVAVTSYSRKAWLILELA
jgi:hypothetical protein